MLFLFKYDEGDISQYKNMRMSTYFNCFREETNISIMLEGIHQFYLQEPDI